MLSFAMVSSVCIGLPSTSLLADLPITCPASQTRLQVTSSIVRVCPAMHVQGITGWLNVVICRWLKKRNGSRKILLLCLATIPSLCCAETMKASPAFRVTRSFRLFHKELTLSRAGDSLRCFTPPQLSCRPLAALPFEASKSNRCYATAVTKRWCTSLFAPPSPRTGAQMKNNCLVCLMSDMEGYFSRSSSASIKPQFMYFAHGYQRRRGRNAVPPGFAYLQLPSSSLFFSFREKSAQASPFTVTEECAHIESAVCPGTQRAFASAAATPAQAAPETPEKSASLLEALKHLRTLTGCSVVACKEALESSKGDVHAAIAWLRRRGLAVTGKAAADASSCPQRQQTEGLIAVASWRASPDDEAGHSRQKQRGKEGTSGSSSSSSWTHEGEVALKLSCSTDFVVRNKRITQFARRAAVLLADHLQRVGLRDMLTAPTTTEAHAEHRDCTRADTASSAYREQKPPSESAVCPTQHAGGVVVRGAPLVERLLSLPWSPGEEAPGGAYDAASAEKALFKAGNFFQEQQQLLEASSRQKKGQPVQVSEKEEGLEQGHRKRGKPATKGSTHKQASEETQSTIGEELQYLSSIVKEPLTITDAVAIETPVDSGTVASYVHGIIEKQVGTLAVLVALAVDHERDGDARSNQQAAGRSTSAAMETVRGRRSSQGLQREQQQLQREEETWQKHRGGKAERKSEASSPKDVPQQRTEGLPKTTARSGLVERLRTLAESICMQVAAGRPIAVVRNAASAIHFSGAKPHFTRLLTAYVVEAAGLDEHSLGRDLFEREKGICQAQAEATGKPPGTIERMVTGKLNKWLKDVLLLRQTWLLDDSGMTVQQKLSEFAAQQHMKTVPRIETFVKIQVH